MKKNLLKDLLRTDQTVFSFKELLIKLKPTNLENFKSQLSYYVKQGDLYHIRRGLYAKDGNYNRLELATKIFKPSYISFETVLRSAGITFQYYSQIFIASYQSREIICDGQIYIFRTIKSLVLTNSLGIQIHDEYSIASPERAFLDVIYLNKNYHFDNLDPLYWNKVYEILPIYGDNKTMKKRVDNYYNSFTKTLTGRLSNKLLKNRKDAV